MPPSPPPRSLQEALDAIKGLEFRLEQLTQENRDLNLMLATTVEHGDAIETLLSETNLKLKSEIAERKQAQAKLQNLLELISDQKADLEIIMQTVMEHGDIVDAQWREKFGITIELANIDPLTQSANRRRFDHYLNEQWQLHITNQRTLALVICDVDHFKLFNDHYGHIKGDDCLRRVAHCLSASLRHTEDLLCRYGGEEFVSILPDTDLEGATISAHRMRESLALLDIPHHLSPIAACVTMSFGVGVVTPGACPPETSPTILIAMADAALYDAKRSGRNRIVVSEMPPELYA